ncbi:MAG: ATP-binding protein [Actinobacteria bacterium]|nr:ATP-binding protein [Actinomycetota bacterium]
MTVEPRLESVTLLRQMVTCLLDASEDLSGVDRFALELLTSETVANAVRHGSGPVTLVLGLAPDRLRVGVHDAGEGDPVVLDARPDEPLRGRGMMLVAQAADNWGIDRTGDGKTVWFELEVPAHQTR